MKKVLITLSALGVFASCAPTFNGKSVVHLKTKRDYLYLNGRPYTGTRDSLLRLFGTPTLLEQPRDTNEVHLVALKQTRRTLLLGTNHFKSEETVSIWRRQHVPGTDTLKWLCVLDMPDTELHSVGIVPSRF